jgi:hypothetical protein
METVAVVAQVDIAVPVVMVPVVYKTTAVDQVVAAAAAY